MRHFNGVYFDERIARAILSAKYTPVEMCQFTKIPMTRLKMSVSLEDFCQFDMRGMRRHANRQEKSCPKNYERKMFDQNRKDTS